MGTISRLHITSFRNIESAAVSLSPGISLFHGDNGSGKTSLLEAVFVLATGRSFRTSRVDSMIHHGCEEALITADLSGDMDLSGVSGDMHIGFCKPRQGNHELRIDQEKQRGWERVARRIPVQILDASAFALVEGSPRERRRFLDWGVFHVEQGFLAAWRRASKCIAQRNRLLKTGRSVEEQLQAWDGELVSAAFDADRARSAYFSEFRPLFETIIATFSDEIAKSLEISYYRGWPNDRALSDVLRANRELDMRYGATQEGPHRSDLLLTVGTRKAAEVLSRGQQKLVVSALKIAQGGHFGQQTGANCIYLLDDLPAELDPGNRIRVIDGLVSQGSQILLTSVEQNSLSGSFPKTTKIATFHVERGKIMT